MMNLDAHSEAAEVTAVGVEAMAVAAADMAVGETTVAEIEEAAATDQEDIKL
jgi:hypothetical protein